MRGEVNMDPLYLHLLLNHVPVIGTVGGVLILLAALIRRSGELAITGLVAMVVVALFTIPVYLTGEPAEERVERLPGVSRDAIHEHEEAAEYAIIGMEVAGALALVTLIAAKVKRGISWRLVMATLGVGAFAFTIVARTAFLGGEIRHTEVRDGAAVTAVEDDD